MIYVVSYLVDTMRGVSADYMISSEKYEPWSSVVECDKVRICLIVKQICEEL